jgi:hypothetical protein
MLPEQLQLPKTWLPRSQRRPPCVPLGLCLRQGMCWGRNQLPLPQELLERFRLQEICRALPARSSIQTFRI